MADERRIYNTDGYRKHKRPEGWGSLCPSDLPEDPQHLLDTGVAVHGGGKEAIYNVSGPYVLRAQSHESGRWHGHPIPWSRLPTEAKNGLIAAGRLDNATYLKALRKGWGREYDKG